MRIWCDSVFAFFWTFVALAVLCTTPLQAGTPAVSPSDVGIQRPVGPAPEDYDPTNVCQDYLADSGSSSSSGVPRPFSFTVPDTCAFTVIIHDAYSFTGYGYTIVVADIPLTQSYTINGTMGSGSPDWPSTSFVQTGRIYRDAVPSTCAYPKACPGVNDLANHDADRYDFSNVFYAGDCVQVTLTCPTQMPHGVAYYLSGTCGGPTYDMSFHDQYNRSELCLNSETGDYVYNVLSGPYAGQSFTGTAVIAQYTPTLFLFSTPCPSGSAHCLSGNWNTVRFTASAILRSYTPLRFSSSLFDGNYTDSPPCGGGNGD